MSYLLIESSNAEYHADRTALSSSGLKLLLADPHSFYTKYILDTPEIEKHNQAFEDGTLLHALILEPHLIATQYAIFNGLRKAGAAYESFKVENPGKVVISLPQMTRAEKWYQGYKANEVAINMVSGGLAEHTMLGECLGIKLKSRADYINIDKSYIADVKTTSAPTDIDAFRQTVEAFDYALSAALYCEIAQQNYGKLFDFYFIVVSKQDAGCAVYKASSELLLKGRNELTKALVLYKKCKESGIWAPEQPKVDFSTSQYEIQEI